MVPDHFTTVFGARRGASRPEVDALQARRCAIFEALLSRVPEAIVEDLYLKLHDGLRYIAVARGDEDQGLYVVGGALTVSETSKLWDSDLMQGLFPEAIIDLEAPSTRSCIVVPAPKGEEWGSGIEDLQPYLRE